MEVLGYLATTFMGLSLGLLGGGGSILTVPILVYLFGRDPLTATTQSLFVVGTTALVGGMLALRRGEVELKTGLLFALPGFLGVSVARHVLLPGLPDPLVLWGSWEIPKALLIMGLFAFLMISASISMIRGRAGDVRPSSVSPALKNSAILIQGFFVGSVTGLVGAGGGFLIIPALVMLVGLPMKKAVGTSLFIIAANSLIGFAGSLRSSAAVDGFFLLSLTLIALVGLAMGIRFSGRFSDKTLKKGFGYFVLGMGGLILLDQLRHL